MGFNPTYGNMSMHHQPVLLTETLAGLAIKPDGIYVDATFGRGGHSQAILHQLNAGGRLIAIDKDTAAIEFAQDHFAHDPRFKIYHGSFAQIAEYAALENIKGQIDGILVDLGVSSPQLDDPARGFSFLKEGPLDMRMNPEQMLDAFHFINHAPEEILANVFFEYGEERFSRRIARALVHARLQSPITTTTALAELVKQANPKWEKHKHPATRIFQAIRIYVNHELEDLEQFLPSAYEILAPGGRLAVISFHSLEDRAVKHFMRAQEQGPNLPRDVPIMQKQQAIHFKRVGKAIKPSAQEIQENIRSRSAILRIGEKTL